MEAENGLPYFFLPFSHDNEIYNLIITRKHVFSW